MSTDFPSEYHLTGADYFQVFLDRHHRRFGTTGNVSRLALFLDSRPEITQLEAAINNIPYIQWLHSLRLKLSSFFGLPKWKQEVLSPVRIIVHDRPYEHLTDCDKLMNRDIQPADESPIAFDLVYVPGKYVLVFSWNHILLDARSAEIIVAQIAGGPKAQFFPGVDSTDVPWKSRIQHINKVKKFLIPNVKDGIRHMSGRVKHSGVNFRSILLTKEETLRMDEVMEEEKVGIARSAYFLAATQLAFRSVANKNKLPIWIPVPQDRRRKGQTGPVMSNQVSFLFYGVQHENNTMSGSIGQLRNQMLHQMRERLPDSYRIMMDSMRRFPGWLYRHLVASPTKGGLASFFFSDTGTTLDDVSEIGGVKVSDAVHIPPNSGFPGLTVIFMRRKGMQRVIYSFPSGAALSSSMDTFDDELRRNLLAK